MVKRLSTEKGTLIEGILMNYMFTTDEWVDTGDPDLPFSTVYDFQRTKSKEENQVERCVLNFDEISLRLELQSDLYYDHPEYLKIQIRMIIKEYSISSNFIKDRMDAVVDLQEVELTILRIMHELETHTLPRHGLVFKD